MAMGGDGRVIIDTELDDTGLSRGMDGFSGKLGKFGTAAKVVAAGAAAAGTAVVSLIYKSVEAYARYEQLVGGVETLFGAGGKTLDEYAKSVGKSTDAVQGEYDKLMSAQQTVLDNAADAYKNAGMSANEYMNTVTSFAASLTSSLGGDTQAAAEKANLAINDMADNANKMGTSMEMIQNAYQGFAKQNYTMLDNLKLGYGGTKEEMQRLLEDAEKISGIHYDISSYADVVDAIHVIQTEMGITGTTAEEAQHTIEGSLNMTKAAWENLIVGISDDNADFDKLMQNFIDSAMAFGDNILPRIEIALQGIAKLIQGVAPVIATELPKLIQSVLPQLISAAGNMIIALAQGIVDALPSIAQTGMQAATSFLQGFAEILPELIPQISQMIFDVCDAIIENLPAVMDAGLQVALALAEGLLEAIPQIIEQLPILIEKIVSFITGNKGTMMETAFDLFMALVKVIPTVIIELIKALPQIITAIVKGIASGSQQMKESGSSILKKLWDGIKSWAGSLKSKIVSLAQSLPGKIKAGIGSLISIGKNWIEGLWNGINDKKDWLCNKIRSLAKSAKDAIKDFFGIKSPSRVMRDEVGKFITLGIGQGIILETKNLIQTARNQMSKLLGAYEVGAINTESIASAGITSRLLTNDSMIGGRLLGQMGNQTVVNQEINFNVENTSPVQTARMLKDQALYGLAGA
jgi:phage-related protein